MTVRDRLLLLFACCALGLAVLLVLGLSYTERLSTHSGFHGVRVADSVAQFPGLRRPRHTALVVIDGLGYQEAQTMRSLALLAERGQCRKTDVGSLSLSRPVYAVLSTGLEADRTGARFNDDSTALAAESVWDVAREAGLSVAAVSEVGWWRELFPRGFDSYVLADRADDYFSLVPPADVQVIHPLYVDETGHHDGGAASGAYAAAVARVDRELGRYLETLDLTQDLVVVTADHGHSLRGGHGGRQDRIANVLTCHAGRGVQHVPGLGALRSETIGPSLALLLGLRFPADMRAGDDDLDALFSIADPAAFPPGYLDDRRQAVERYREHNAAQLRAWLPDSDGSWDRFYAAHRGSQRRAALPFVVLLVLVPLGLAHLHARGGAGPRAGRFAGLVPGLLGGVFILMVGLVAYALQVGLRGSFDLSAVAYREDFLAFTLALGVTCSVVAVGAHLLVRRSLPALLLDYSALSVVGTLLSLAHPVALGWRLGFPVPAPAVFFFPYWAALFLGVVNGAGLLLAGAAAVLEVGKRRRAAG